MNQLAEANRNISLLETSITMQPFSAVAMETRAYAAEMMIAEETGRKRQLLNHLLELHHESLERVQEVNALVTSCENEYNFYNQTASNYLAAGNIEGWELASEMRKKAFDEKIRYTELATEIWTLGGQILEAIKGETLPRLLPLTNLDDLPFESAQPDIMTTFESLVKRHPQDVIDYISDHRLVENSVESALCEITGGRVNVEDVMQSFDEVLQDEYAGFYEALNTAYTGNEATFRQELAACVEAYA